MIFRQFFHHESSTYSYLIADNQTKEAALIDPVKDDTDKYLQILKDLSLKLIYALDTHTHADHITALGPLRDATGCKTVIGEGAAAGCASQYIKDEEVIKVGSLDIKALKTPGHTIESYCYLMSDRIFTGDTLLIRGCGRTDFQNGDSEDLYKSLQRLIALDKTITVYPAHDYKGWTSSSIGEEANNNPRLQFKTMEEFAHFMDNLNLPNPKMMDIAIPANLQCGNN